MRGVLERADIIRWLLDSFTDARDTISRPRMGEGRPGKAGSRPPGHMPELWGQGSYQALEDGLRLLRAQHPEEYWHVSQRYLLRRRGRITVIHERPGPKGVLREPRVVTIDVYHPKVSPALVNQGVTLLSSLITGGVWLPKELHEVATG